ncbi:MAG: VCBS repeat-containing protein [Planctomycetes bacterium]|nr:VCBS repeat-containing protein [Planctomycetota bacterium]
MSSPNLFYSTLTMNIKSTIFSIALLLSAGTAADEKPAAQPAPRSDGNLQIPTPKLSEPGKWPLDAFLSKLESGRDEWTSERTSEELTGILEKLAAGLGKAGGAESVKDLLAEHFAGDAPLPEPLRPVLSNDLAAAWLWLPGQGAGTERLGREAFPAAFQRLGALFSKVAKIQVKTYRADRLSNDPPQFSTEVLFEMDGQAGLDPGQIQQKGPAPFLQIRGHWRIRWEKSAGAAWRMAGFEVRRFEKAALKQRLFTEISDQALGAVPSYREQLRYGLEYWRGRIDSASGIEVYGHQGIACGDYDGDGREDLYIAQAAGLPNRLYRARGDGTFEDCTDLEVLGSLDETGAALFFDRENDGDQDLLAVTSLELLLFDNDGKGRFRRVEESGLEAAQDRRATMIGAAVADYDNDGFLDLYIISYVFWAGSASRRSSPYPFPYHDANNGAPNFLFRNRGDGAFEEVTRASGMDANNRRYSLAASWCDYDQDGDVDLYVANDFGKNNLYQNRGHGTFKDVAREAGVEDVGNGMSVQWQDYDGDGWDDLYVGNMWSSAGNRLAAQPQFRRREGGNPGVHQRMARGNSLFRNRRDGAFEDVSEKANAAFGRWAWSSALVDVDLDGREDIYILNGFVTGERHDDL